MGGVSSVPQIIGGLATRLLYYLIGANYNSQSISSSVNRGDQALERWRGKDYHVYDRYGSQYFDKDGDLAHEFYEEQVVENKPVMVRQDVTKLRHEGWIPYNIPRLHYDFPAVILSH